MTDLLSQLNAAEKPTVAVEAAEALGKIGGIPARAALAQFLLAADTADARMSDAIGSALIGLWRAGETGVAPFARWITSPDPEIRWRAVYGLTRRARPESVELVIDRIADPDPRVRSFAVRGLTFPQVSSARGSPALVLPRLIPLLEDSSYSVRIETIRVLGGYQPPEAAQALLELANVTQSRKTVRSAGLLDMQIKDFRTKRVVNQEKFNGEYNWMCEWAHFNGDERALTPAQLRKCKSQELLPPDPQQLFIEFSKPIYERLTSKLQTYYAKY